MKNVVLFEPHIQSLNIGDEIIVEAAERQLDFLLKEAFVIRASTHSPGLSFFQNIRANPLVRFFDSVDLKFVCGSNLLWWNMLRFRPQWNMSIFDYKLFENSILLGVGTSSDGRRSLNAYTRHLYSRVLRKDVIHSVRDDHVGNILRDLKLPYLNTGCPTMWGFTEEFCRTIATSKAENVVFTLTDYNRDYAKDAEFISILRAQFRELIFWPQGPGDVAYLSALDAGKEIEILPPNLLAFSSALERPDIEYVGTRLHAGMYAMQRGVRSTMLVIDDRLRSLAASYSLRSVERENVSELPVLLANESKVNVRIREEAIQKWLQQF